MTEQGARVAAGDDSTTAPESSVGPLVDEAVQVLGPDGTLRPSDAARPLMHHIEALTDDDLLAMYRDMLFTRRFDEQGMNLQRQGQLGLWVPAIGQEGAQIGSAHAMRPHDFVFPSYREHGVLHVRGVDLINVLRLFRGVTSGGWLHDGARTNIYTLVIGSQALHAAGYAMGQTLDHATNTGDPERDEATIAYFGDGATSQGDVSEAFTFARSFNAPVLFFCQNNQWAISVPVRVQSPEPLYLRSRGFGIPSVQIDGNDVLASYAATREYLEQAREGGGPRFIEAVTYRIGAHTSTDDPTKYRTRDEEAEWAAKDPIVRFEAYLRSRGIDQAEFDRAEEDAKAFALDIRDRTFKLEDPPMQSIFEGVYSDDHPLMVEQRAWLEAYEASFAQGTSAAPSGAANEAEGASA